MQIGGLHSTDTGYHFKASRSPHHLRDKIQFTPVRLPLITRSRLISRYPKISSLNFRPTEPLDFFTWISIAEATFCLTLLALLVVAVHRWSELDYSDVALRLLLGLFELNFPEKQLKSTGSIAGKYLLIFSFLHLLYWNIFFNLDLRRYIIGQRIEYLTQSLNEVNPWKEIILYFDMYNSNINVGMFQHMLEAREYVHLQGNRNPTCSTNWNGEKKEYELWYWKVIGLSRSFGHGDVYFHCAVDFVATADNSLGVIEENSFVQYAKFWHKRKESHGQTQFPVQVLENRYQDERMQMAFGAKDQVWGEQINRLSFRLEQSGIPLLLEPQLRNDVSRDRKITDEDERIDANDMVDVIDIYALLSTLLYLAFGVEYLYHLYHDKRKRKKEKFWRKPRRIHNSRKVLKSICTFLLIGFTAYFALYIRLLQDHRKTFFRADFTFAVGYRPPGSWNFIQLQKDFLYVFSVDERHSNKWHFCLRLILGDYLDLKPARARLRSRSYGAYDRHSRSFLTCDTIEEERKLVALYNNELLIQLLVTYVTQTSQQVVLRLRCR